MPISRVGSARFKVYGVLLLVNTIVLALSAHINHFQEYFYRADVFPLALSVVTMAFIPTMIFLDLGFNNAVTARPPFELTWLAVLGTLWLSFNAFSTSRWRYVTMSLCATIPSDAQYAPYRTWCHELQALRIFVWIEWVMFLVTFAVLLRWSITQHSLGRRDVWSTSFSRITTHRGDTNSEFLQWEKFAPRPFPQSPQPPFDRSSPGMPQAHLPTSPAQVEYAMPAAAEYPQYPGEQFVPPPHAQYIPPSHMHHMPPARFEQPSVYLHDPPQAY